MNRAAEVRVEHWEENLKDTLLSPPASSDVVAIARVGWDDGDRIYEALMPDGSTYRMVGDECECGSNNHVEPASEVTEWNRRLTASCDHQRAQLKSTNVGGSCSNCGEVSVEVEDHTDDYGNVVMQSFSCAGCGQPRREV